MEEKKEEMIDFITQKILEKRKIPEELNIDLEEFFYDQISNVNEKCSLCEIYEKYFGDVSLVLCELIEDGAEDEKIKKIVFDEFADELEDEIWEKLRGWDEKELEKLCKKLKR